MTAELISRIKEEEKAYIDDEIVELVISAEKDLDARPQMLADSINAELCDLQYLATPGRLAGMQRCLLDCESAAIDGFCEASLSRERNWAQLMHVNLFLSNDHTARMDLTGNHVSVLYHPSGQPYQELLEDAKFVQESVYLFKAADDADITTDTGFVDLVSRTYYPSIPRILHFDFHAELEKARAEQKKRVREEYIKDEYIVTAMLRDGKGADKNAGRIRRGRTEPAESFPGRR